MGWARLPSWGFVGPTFPRFTVTCSSASMWATTRRRISLNVFARFLIKESLNDPDRIPRPKACTIRASSLVWSFTTNTPNRFRKSFRALLDIASPRRGRKRQGWISVDYELFLNNVKNWSNEVMCPSGRPMNQSNVVLANVRMNSLQCMASIPLEIIIWVWKVVMWASGSSIPVKVILGVMKFVGITTLMIAWENDMGRALTGIGGLCSPAECSPKRCRSLRSSSLALRNSSLLVRDASSSTLNWSCLSACSARTSTKILSWSALDVVIVSWRVWTVSMSCCRVKLSPSSCPDGPCRVFLISPGSWFYRVPRWAPNVLAGWPGRRLTLGTSCDFVCLCWNLLFPLDVGTWLRLKQRRPYLLIALRRSN